MGWRRAGGGNRLAKPPSPEACFRGLPPASASPSLDINSVKNAPLLHRLEHAGYLAVKGLLRVLPHGAARCLGGGLGELGYWLVARRRRVALKNLARVFPELDAAGRRRLARASFRHFGMALCDSLSIARFGPVELCRRLTLEGWEHLEHARRRGNGVCVMSGHLGCWEVAADTLGLYGGGFQIVARALDNPWLDRDVRQLRERFGNHLIAKRGTLRRLFQIVHGGGRLGILIDQRVRAKEGIVVPFFDCPAVASPVLARLSLRTGAPVVPIFGYALPGGRYRVVLHPPILPGDARPEPGEDESAALTRRYLELVEREIRRAPEQWMWMHDRWKV